MQKQYKITHKEKEEDDSPFVQFIKQEKKQDKFNIDNMNKYFNATDFVVFGVCSFSLIWMILYKFLFINNDFLYPLWENANIAGEITYTVFSSVVAAGIFYLVTVYIPRYNSIKKMKTYIVYDLYNYETTAEIIVKNIYKSDRINKYTLVEFPRRMTDQNWDNAKTDFVNSYKVIDISILVATFNNLVKNLEPVYFNYSNIFPQEINIMLNGFRLNGVNLPYEIAKSKKEVEYSDAVFEDFFGELVEGLLICQTLRKQYNLNS